MSRLIHRKDENMSHVVATLAVAAVCLLPWGVLAQGYPSKSIRFVDTIPRSATGKIQRRRLLELLD